jgi:replicative DNA helicase
MAFAIGLQAIRALCVAQKPLDWQRAKLSPVLFTAYETPAYEWAVAHLKQNHALPQVETLVQAFPSEFSAMDTVEPPSYYLKHLENRFIYQQINKANLGSQEILKNLNDAPDNQKAKMLEDAEQVLRQTVNQITMQRYRQRILDVGKEGPSMVLAAYHNAATQDLVAKFGWPYMDEQCGSIMPGEMVSFVGRPAMGKTWLTLKMALENWQQQKQNVMFVSMEMATLPIAQRIAAMYTHCGIGQLKIHGFSSSTYMNFATSLKVMGQEEAKFYVIDGNLAASVEDIYTLADMLLCRIVVIDGGYLVKHRNTRLDRFQRVAENVELMKQNGSDLDCITAVSWQLNREAEKKKKDGKEVTVGEIGYSDAIGQISSIVLGLFEDDGVETMKRRKVNVMKGRNGEIGEFSIAWDFADMVFDQVDPAPQGTQAQQGDLEWV